MKKIDKILIKLSKQYFNYFNKKNLDKLDFLFEKNIILKDWENSIKGKKSVLNFNKKIFKKFKKIDVKIKNICISTKNRITFNQIIINLNNNFIEVLDIIYFNKKNKIVKIEAYKK